VTPTAALATGPDTVAALAAAAGLVSLATARWPKHDGDGPPAPLAGFVGSSFSPMVAEVAERCLRQYYRQPPVDRASGDRTAVVIVSASGDLASAVAVAQAVDSDSRVAPLLFFQAVPNAVAGHVAARWGLAGPVVCLGPTDDQLADGLAVAALTIGDGDADDALVVWAEQASTDGEGDRALAVLVSDTDRKHRQKAHTDSEGPGP
jgi:hypothetical protein